MVEVEVAVLEVVLEVAVVVDVDLAAAVGVAAYVVTAVGIHRRSFLRSYVIAAILHLKA